MLRAGRAERRKAAHREQCAAGHYNRWDVDVELDGFAVRFSGVVLSAIGRAVPDALNQHVPGMDAPARRRSLTS